MCLRCACCWLAFRAAKICPEPRQRWSESNPKCSSPFCDRDTGYWLPTREEVNGDYSGNTGEFANGCSIWGSFTIRAHIQEHRAFVACCMECGRTMRHIIKIRGRRSQREHVVVASRDRVLMNAHDLGVHGLPPDDHLLLSEISRFESLNELD